VELARRGVMNELDKGARRSAAALELGTILLLAWPLLVAIPVLRGELGISWDMLNHHVYLGWTAAAPRFDRDVLAAAYQSYQFPYLYWPVYQLAVGGATGAQAGFVLASLQLLNVPPVWIMARRCIPDAGWFGACMRLLAVVLAFLSVLVLSLLDSTSNDLLSASPFLWALAVALGPATGAEPPGRSRRRAVVSGVLAGVAVAFKWSNGPLALLLPLLWAWAPGTVRERAQAVVAGSAAVLAGFAVTYGFWGWQLWTHFGNPFFPMFDNWFEPVRATVGWQR